MVPLAFIVIPTFIVIPANVGIQGCERLVRLPWVPACAGMTCW